VLLLDDKKTSEGEEQSGERKWDMGSEREKSVWFRNASATLRDSDQLFAVEPELLGQ